MHRNSLLETAGRVFHQAVRMTLNSANDSPMMQELSFDGMISEGRKAVERIQHFGFTSMPLPRDQQQGQSGGGGGGLGIGTTGQLKGAAAEGIALFMGGQRNHPVVIAVDDRRHRPMGLKPGENAQYDDQGQMTLLRRDGVYLVSTDDDGSGNAPAATMLADGTSQKKTRMVSLRHVVKKAQPRPGGQNSGDYKHEGDTVNTEVRMTKGMMDFRTGDNSVASHDKDAAKWTFGGKVHEVTSSDQHSVSSKQVSIKGSQNVTINGEAGVAITGPTTVNGDAVATSMMLDKRDVLIAALEKRLAALEARIG